MTVIPVDSASGPYDIRIARGLLHVLGERVKELIGHAGRVGIVSNPIVWKYHGERVQESFHKEGMVPVVGLHPDGETYKTMDSVMGLLSTFLEHRWERSEPLCVVGGGVTGDMGGLVAALLLRGVPLIHVPTTVVSQVDSSIGGKTGVDHPLGKNLIGVFNPPRVIMADTETLTTLPLRERRAGLGEVLKYAFIGDGELLALLEEKIESLAAPDFDGELWEKVVALCAGDKARIVSADEKESGERMLLNFGHTFGHALEGAMGYSRFLHGEAVAVGMLSAAAMAVSAGFTTPSTLVQMKALIRRAGLPVSWPAGISFEDIHPYLGRDKKTKGGQVSLILPEKVGHVRIVREYEKDLLSRGIFS